MLIGRAPESERLERMLKAAQGGKSGALVLHGDAGVGKTVLLGDAVGRADGFVVLRVQPLEVESELPFASLSDLVRPIAHLLERIPQPQAEALASALALGPPAPGDRFAAAAATLSLLATAASSAPVLAVVDDAHWLDAPSREAIVFAGRRLSNEGVVLLLAMRDRPWLSDAGLETMPIGGLPLSAAAELVDRARPAITRELRDRVIAETGGNPLAMLETLATLSEAQLDGSEPLAGPIPVGASIEAAFGQQVRDLQPATRLALLVAAASDSGDLDEMERALNAAGLGWGDLKPAEQLGLISLMDGRIEFKHPLLRSATYQLHEADERRAAHRALAAAIEPSEPDRIAWHLASAAAGPDEAIAVALEQAGIRAKARRGHVAASRALELAGRLSPAPTDKSRRLLAAAEAAFLGNEADGSLTILDGLLEEAEEPTSRADIQMMRGMALMGRQPPERTRLLLEEEAAAVEHHDPKRAAALLVQAYFCAMMAGRADLARDTAARSLDLVGPAGGPIASAATAGLGEALIAVGETKRGRALLESLRPLLDGLDPIGEASYVVYGIAAGFMWLEDWATARELFQRAMQVARSAAAPGALPLPLAGLSELEFRTGNFALAYAAASKSVQLCIDTGQDVNLPYALQALARVEAVLGLDDACREHAGAALREARRIEVGSIESIAPAALGLMELGRGRSNEAIDALEAAARAACGPTHSTVQWPADLIEAYARCGRIQDAERLLEELAEEVKQTGLRWTAACVARYRGVLAPEGEFEDWFEQALAIHEQDPSSFEVARTELWLGRRRRHARRRADARKALHSALTTFEALSAEPWAEQARMELRATGEVPAPSRDGSLRDLTPQELQVALIVAKGATNNETAAALFLSPKTVEFHLHNTYGKLGVRSRTELVRKVGLEA